jgi:DNA-binding FrmR family transcriptional regulator
MKPDQQSDIVRRLRCVAGHLNAVIEMAEAGQPCEQVLHQLGAVDAAIRVAGSKLIICQAESIRSVILNSASPKERFAELKHLQALYTIFLQYPNHNIEVSHD